MQIKVTDLCDLPGLMTNFNQLVLREFEIQKIFMCFDLPLSTLNWPQAESINDLDNYLLAKSLATPLSGSKTNSNTQTSGTPVMNLLSEFQAIKDTGAEE